MISDRRVSVPRLAWRITRRKRFHGPKAPGYRTPLAGAWLYWFTRDPLAAIGKALEVHGDLSRAEIRLPGLDLAMHLVVHPDHARHVLMENQHNYRKAFTYAPLKALLGNGLLTSEGETWLTQRRLIQPMFHQRQIAEFIDPIWDACAVMSESWKGVPSDQPIEMCEQMSSLTLDIVGRALFGSSLGADGPRVSQAVGTLQELALKAFRNPMYWPFAAAPQKVPVRRYREAVKTMDEIIFNLISQRRRSGEASPDLLGKLMTARDEGTDEPMSDVQIRDELMTFMLAGHETTATALSWTFYLLSKDVDGRRRLIAEVDDVLGDRPPELDDYQRLEYTRAVLQEAMRLYPPAWFVDREAIGDDEIGGYAIAAGSTVSVSPYFVHRHRDFWAEPERFEPERFMRPDDATKRAYIPFGSGRRGCIASGFAMLEGVLALATISRRYLLDLVPGHPVATRAEVTLTPRDGLPMFIRERNR